jgi:hypothetical protein
MADLKARARRAWRGYAPKTYLRVCLSAVWVRGLSLVGFTLFNRTGGWVINIFPSLVMAAVAFGIVARRLTRRRAGKAGHS